MELLRVDGLQTHFFTRKGVVRAVDGISFGLKRGEILGLVGESGAGKSITGFSIIRLIDPPGRIVNGKILLEGRNLLQLDAATMDAIRGDHISMIFQDPQTSLNPVLSIGRQLTETICYHRQDVSGKEAQARSVEMLRQVGIASPLKRLRSYPHQLSGGMQQRMVIAMALINNPKLLIADEPTTALDVTIQAQILMLMKKLCEQYDSSLVLITHDISVVAQMCHRVAVMYAGRIVEYGEKSDILYHPLHPYTRGLIACLPKLNETRDRLYQIPGVMPSLLDLPAGCYFRNRCPDAGDNCLEYPELRWINGRHVACHRVK